MFFKKYPFARSSVVKVVTTGLFWKVETSNGRLRLEQRSDRRETLPKRVSEDSRHFIFRRRKIFFDEIFGPKNLVFVDSAWFWTSYGQMDLKISFHVKFCFI